MCLVTCIGLGGKTAGTEDLRLFALITEGIVDTAQTEVNDRWIVVLEDIDGIVYRPHGSVIIQYTCHI
jgi:hypothetical protein